MNLAEQLAKAKGELLDKISSAIFEFQQCTGLRVTDIRTVGSSSDPAGVVHVRVTINSGEL